MKANFVVLALAYYAFLTLSVTEAKEQASLENVADWTKEQAQAYLDKYQIVTKNDQNDILKTIQGYQDAAKANTEHFINNPSDPVNKIVQSAKNKLTSSFKLSTENVKALGKDIQHQLKQLELSGSLTQDKVKQSLDKLQHRVVRQKILSESQFKELSQDIQDRFSADPAWYQRLWNQVPSTSDLYHEDSYSTWVKNKIAARLEENKELTKEEIQTVADTLRQAIAGSASNLSQLGDSRWWKKVSNDLIKNAKLKEAQAESVVESLQDEVTAYKIFAMNYASEAVDDTNNFLNRAGSYIKDAGQQVYQAVVNTPSSSVSSAVSVAQSAAASATDAAGQAASSAVDAAGSSASSLHSQATQTAEDIKNSIGNFWRQKELETYRKVGYTEAHVEWIQNYLSKTFHNKASATKDTIFNAVRTIRQYLVQAKVQSLTHIDHQLKSLEDLIEHWRVYTIRDEL
ncbi:hypothetical protein BY458DRAFT_513688 [Sporodiniella umbellata]|nr:hypothetical protein BY458DRAFT_513688 [Sporodiniella umbellata]